jgi:hypothetical protein
MDCQTFPILSPSFLMLPANVLASRFDRSFALYRDFAESLDEPTLGEKLPGLPSNTIGLQLWCVVGARESYARAIGAGSWAGFACSLASPMEKSPVAEALGRSANEVRLVLDGIEGFSETQQGLILDLLEHEAAHQGQLIRYLYGLRLAIPESWRARYALSDLS